MPVTTRVCGNCGRLDCTCPDRELIPSELVGWAAVFAGPDERPREHPDVHRFDHVLDPGLPTTPVRMEDVVEIAHRAAGKDDGPPWIVVVRLTDGRWAYISYTVQITGDVFWTFAIAATKQRLWWWALTDDDRERFTSQLTLEEREEELVQIDELLESPDRASRALGESRMLQLHLRR